MRIANIDGVPHLISNTPNGDHDCISVAAATGGAITAGFPEIFGVLDQVSALLRKVEVGDVLPPDATPEPVDPRTLGCAVGVPRQVFAIGLNYAEHIAEFTSPLGEMPPFFTKFPSCLAGPFDDVPLAGEFMDWEVELVAVISKPARNVSEADALDHVAGYTVGQDITDRVLQQAASGQFCLGKSRRGCGPIGPWVVTPDEFASAELDPTSLKLGCSVNGETMQSGNTEAMIYTVARLVSLLSSVTDLLTGDVIFTGTPSGVGKAQIPPRSLQPGDVLESWIEGIGRLRNRCVAAPTASMG
ncbi:MAG: fumarylacetoacetate hydrolase family protein [Microthrixaceae bacterium]|nr:fumarylacetoacetate hydrolase family protein [Microthrixaceae bacterium]